MAHLVPNVVRKGFSSAAKAWTANTIAADADETVRFLAGAMQQSSVNQRMGWGVGRGAPHEFHPPPLADCHAVQTERRERLDRTGLK